MAHNPAKRLQVLPAELEQGSTLLFYGRDEELQQLESACLNENTRLVNLLAPTGLGKTTLVYGWLAHCKAIDWLGADYVFGWCFPSTQSTDDVQAILAEFLREALLWFGEQPEGLCCAVQAERLALYLQQGSFLILDNLPAALAHIEQGEYAGLYAGENHPDKADNALFAVYHLLMQLVTRQVVAKPGICLLVGEQLPLFSSADEGIVQTISLGNLPVKAGAQLLRAKGVPGSTQELAVISAQFGHHPLALTLLANYLQEACAGDLAKLDTIPIWPDPEANGLHARRVLAAYANWLHNTPDLALVYLLSLFRQPLSLEDLYAFLSQHLRPRFFWRKNQGQLPVPVVLQRLCGISRSRVGHLQQRLDRLNLLSPPVGPAIFDLHTLVRGYFYQQLKTRFYTDCQHIEKLVAEHKSHKAPDLPVIGTETRVFVATYAPETEYEPAGEPVEVVASALVSAEKDARIHQHSGPGQDLFIERLQTRQDNAVAEKNWLLASVLARQLYEQRLVRLDLSAAMLCLRQSAAYAHLAQDPAIVQQSMRLLDSLQQTVRQDDAKQGEECIPGSRA